MVCNPGIPLPISPPFPPVFDGGKFPPFVDLSRAAITCLIAWYVPSKVPYYEGTCLLASKVPSFVPYLLRTKVPPKVPS